MKLVHGDNCFLKDLFWRKQWLIPHHVFPVTPTPTFHPTARCPFCPGTLSPGCVGTGIGVSHLGTEGTKTVCSANLGPSPGACSGGP